MTWTFHDSSVSVCLNPKKSHTYRGGRGQFLIPGPQDKVKPANLHEERECRSIFHRRARGPTGRLRPTRAGFAVAASR